MKITKIFGFTLSMQMATIITIVFIGLESALLYQQNYAESNLTTLFFFGLISGILMIVAVIMHELAHALVAKSIGLEIKEISLNVLGGATQLDKEPESPWGEIKMAGSGPVISILVGGLFLLLSFIFSASFPKALFYNLGIANVGLGIFNLLPAYPVDGGRILRALIWIKKPKTGATKIAALIGVILSSILVMVGVFIAIWITNGIILGIYLVFVGYSIGKSSRQSYKIIHTQDVLTKISISSLQRPLSPQVSSELKIVDIVRNNFVTQQCRVVMVVEKGNFLGFFHKDQLQTIPLDVRKYGLVKDVYVPMSSVQTITNADSANDLVNLLRDNDHKIDLAAVIDTDKNLRGYVDLFDLEKTLHSAMRKR